MDNKINMFRKLSIFAVTVLALTLAAEVNAQSPKKILGKATKNDLGAVAVDTSGSPKAAGWTSLAIGTR